MRAWLDILLAFVFVCIFAIAFLSVNKFDYERIYFVNDKEEVMKKYESTVPIKVVFSVKYIPQCEFSNPEFLLEMWNKINDLPVFDYIKTPFSKTQGLTFNGFVYFLNKERKAIQISDDIKIGDKLYGAENNQVIKYIKSTMKAKVFSINNIVKTLDSKEIKIYVKKLDNQKEEIHLYALKSLRNFMKDSTEVDNVEKIGTVLSKYRNPLYSLLVLKGKNEFLRLEILSDDYFSIYYMNDFICLRKSGLHFELKEQSR